MARASHWKWALVVLGAGVASMFYTSGFAYDGIEFLSPIPRYVGLVLAALGLGFLAALVVRRDGGKRGPKFITITIVVCAAGTVLLVGGASSGSDAVADWRTLGGAIVLPFGVGLAAGLVREKLKPGIASVAIPLAAVVIGAVAVVATSDIAPPTFDEASPHLFRVGLVLTVSGLLWWVAECFGTAVMRSTALVALLAIVLALINAGDDTRIESDADAYLALRASVGNELGNVLLVGDPQERSIEATTEGDVDSGAGGAVDADGNQSGPSSEDGTGDSDRVGGDADSLTPSDEGVPAADILPESEPVAGSGAAGSSTADGDGVRARDRTQAANAAERLNRAVGVADAAAAECQVVQARLLGGGLRSLVSLPEPSTAGEFASGDGVVAAATAATVDDGGQTTGETTALGTNQGEDVRQFLRLVEATGLTAELGGEGPFTVFVPPSADWETVLEDLDIEESDVLPGRLVEERRLVEIVGHHVAVGSFDEKELRRANGTALPTLAGDGLRLGSGTEGLEADDEVIEQFELLAAGNGVLHQVAGVLQPETDLMGLLHRDGDFDTLVSALEATDLADFLAADNPFTVVAPTDEAFLDWEFADRLGTPDGRHLVQQLIVENALDSDDLLGAAGNELSSLNGTKLSVGSTRSPSTADDSDGALIPTIEGVKLREYRNGDATNGIVFVVDELGSRYPADRRECQPRDASLELLRLLRAELVGALTRTSNEGAQSQLSGRLTEVDTQISTIEENVAVHHLVIDGADSVVGDSIGFAVNDDVTARLGGWGWMVLAVLLVLGYRRLEIINGGREPGPVRIEPVSESASEAAGAADVRHASVMIGNRLGQAEVREPASLPGGDSTRQVAEVLQDEGLPGGKAAQAIIQLFQNTAFPEKGVSVTASVERLATDAQERVRVTVSVSEARNQRLVYSQPFVAATLDEAAEQAAFFVAASLLATSRVVAPWARWSEDDGTGLRAYQQVALDERTRQERYGPVERRKKLERAVAACPHSGVARVALGQQLQIVGPLVDDDALVAIPDDPAQSISPAERREIGRSLVTGILQLAWATTVFPEFLIGHYRLAAGLSMLSEDVDLMWRFDDAGGAAAVSTSGRHPYLHASELSNQVADVLLIPTRHRAPAVDEAALDPRRTRARWRLRRGWSNLVDRLRDWLDITSNTSARAGVDEAARLRQRRLELSSPQSDDPKPSWRERFPWRLPSASATKSDVVGVGSQSGRSLDEERSGHDVPEGSSDDAPEPATLLELAAKEVETGIFALRWYPFVRWWRQEERHYWLSMLLDRRLRRREEAAFRILGEVITLRERTLAATRSTTSADELSSAEFAEMENRVEVLHMDHRHDAVVSYVTAAYHGVVLARLRGRMIESDCAHGPRAGTRGDGPKCTVCEDRARQVISLLRDARDAPNGHVLSVRWVMRDPDLWHVREVLPAEWTALVRRLEWLEGSLGERVSPQSRHASVKARFRRMLSGLGRIRAPGRGGDETHARTGGRPARSPENEPSRTPSS